MELETALRLEKKFQQRQEKKKTFKRVSLSVPIFMTTTTTNHKARKPLLFQMQKK